jgi:hypothetical protein
MEIPKHALNSTNIVRQRIKSLFKLHKHFCFIIQKFPIILRNLEKCPECLQRFHVEWQGKSSRKGISLILKAKWFFATAFLWHQSFEITYFKTVLILEVLKPNYDFLVPLCLYLVQNY